MAAAVEAGVEVDNFSESAANDDADCQIHHIALDGKLFELLRNCHDECLLFEWDGLKYCRLASRRASAALMGVG